MSTPSMPRLLAGLAATALAVGLVAAPMIAYADPTQTPTPGPTASATPSATPSSTDTGAASPSPSEPDSPPPSTQTSPSDTATPSPSGTTTAARRPRSDALAAPGPAAEEPAVEEQQEVLQVEEASITLAKTASPTRVSRVGQVVRYRFVATNDGEVELTDVRIADELQGLSALTCNREMPATLPSGQTLDCSATLTVTQADLDFGAIYNFASVFGVAAGEEGAPSEDIGAVDDAAVQVDQRPTIALSASVSPTGTADAGDRLRYRATATNTGNVTLTRARITSSLDSLDLDCEPSARATLAPGASISCSGSYRVSAADARRGRVTNELTARAERPFGDVEAGGDDVTDDIRLRVEVNEPADDRSDPGLADTGGPGEAWPVGLVGVAAVVAGAGLLRRGLRS